MLNVHERRECERCGNARAWRRQEPSILVRLAPNAAGRVSPIRQFVRTVQGADDEEEWCNECEESCARRTLRIPADFTCGGASTLPPATALQMAMNDGEWMDVYETCTWNIQDGGRTVNLRSRVAGVIARKQEDGRYVLLTGDEAAWWLVDGVGGAMATRATQEDIRQMTTGGTYGWRVTMAIYIHAHTA